MTGPRREEVEGSRKRFSSKETSGDLSRGKKLKASKTGSRKDSFLHKKRVVLDVSISLGSELELISSGRGSKAPSFRSSRELVSDQELLSAMRASLRTRQWLIFIRMLCLRDLQK